MQCCKQVSEKCACQTSGRSLPNETSSSTPRGDYLHTENYSKPPPYGHLGSAVTSLLQPLFFAAWQKPPYIFLWKNPSLMRPNFFGPLVTVLTGFHCIMFVLNTALKWVNMVGKGSYEQTNDTG